MELTNTEVLQLLKCRQKNTRSSHQLSDLIRNIFSDPLSLSARFEIAKVSDQSNDYSHNLDVHTIIEVYRSVRDLGKSSQIAFCVERTIKKLQEPNSLRNFLQSYRQFRYFFVIALWEELYILSAFRLLLQKCLNLIAHSGSFKEIMSFWIDDIPVQKLSLIVINMQRALQSEFEKMVPGVIDPNNIKFVQLNIRNYCHFFALLYQSNCRTRKLPKQLFANHKIPQYFDPAVQFKLHLSKLDHLDFLSFPFLLPTEYKRTMIEIQSLVQQKYTVQKNMQIDINQLIPHLNQHGSFDIKEFIFLHFKINRNDILNDSMEKLGNTDKNLKSPLRIEFMGQHGNDEGGVRNEYFQLLVKEIFNPFLDMFIPKNSGRVFWLNGYSYEAPIRFEFVGMLLGLAIYNSVLLDIKFPQIVYRKLLSPPHSQNFPEGVLEGLADLEPETYKSMKNILDEKGSLQDLQLFFNIEFEHFGEKIVEELMEKGNKVRVTQKNKHKYVQLYASYYLHTHVQKQFSAFKRGFDKVVNGAMIKLLQPEQLERIICGSPNINFKELELSTKYQGFNSNSPIIKNLWSVLHSLSLQEKRAFLIFVTGTDRVPIQGLKALKFIVQKQGANQEHLPTAHTCFNVLLLPDYNSKSQLETKLKLALKHNQGFGLI